MGDVTPISPDERRRQTALHNAHAPDGKRGRPQGRVSRAQRRHRVVRMMLAGASELEIAQALDMRPSGVSKIVTGLLEEWESQDKAAVEALRELQLQRLDRLLQAVWPDAIGIDPQGNRKTVNLKAVDRALKIEALRARIAGTEAPRKVDLSGDFTFAMSVEEAEDLDRAWVDSGGEVLEGHAVELPPGG